MATLKITKEHVCKVLGSFQWRMMRMASLLLLLLLEFPTIMSSQGYSIPITSDVDATAPAIFFIENRGQFTDKVRFYGQIGGGTLLITTDELWWTVVESISVRHSFFNQTYTYTDTLTPRPQRRGVNFRLQFVGNKVSHQKIVPFDPRPTLIHDFSGVTPYSNLATWGGVRIVDIYPGVDLELTSADNQFVPRLVVRQNAAFLQNDIRLQIEGADEIHANIDALELKTSTGEFSFPLLTLTNVSTEFNSTPTIQSNIVTAPFRQNQVSTATPKVAINTPLPSNYLYGSFIGENYEEYTFVRTDPTGATYVFGYIDIPDSLFPIGLFNGDQTERFFVLKLARDRQNLEFATYITGTNSYLYGMDIAVDGTIFFAGTTDNFDFPTTPNALQPQMRGTSDTFIVKFNASGSEMIYSTFLGGNRRESGGIIKSARNGEVVVFGTTESFDFPVTEGAFQTICRCNYGRDTFIARLNREGSSLDFATYYGGLESEYDGGYETITLDRDENILIGGQSASDDLPLTSNAVDSSRVGDEGFFAKFSANGSDLLYASYFGGSSSDYVGAVSTDSFGSIYIGGHTLSTDLPITPNGYDIICGTDGQCNDRMHRDGFVSKIDPQLGNLVFSTYLGGSHSDIVGGIDVGLLGDVYITLGSVSHESLATPGAFDRSPIIDPDYFFNKALLLRLSPDGSHLYHGTYLGGSVDNGAISILSPMNGVVYSAGGTLSPDFPITPDAYDSTCGTDATCNAAPPYAYGLGDGYVGIMAMPKPLITSTLPITGGIFTAPLEYTDYAFASGTFSTTAIFTHAPRHPLSMPSSYPLVSIYDHTFVNEATDTSGNLLEPTQPYTLSISYLPEELKLVPPETIGLYYWNGSVWELENTAVVDVDKYRITATPSRLGWWTVAGIPYRQHLPLIEINPALVDLFSPLLLPPSHSFH